MEGQESQFGRSSETVSKTSIESSTHTADKLQTQETNYYRYDPMKEKYLGRPAFLENIHQLSEMPVNKTANNDDIYDMQDDDNSEMDNDKFYETRHGKSLLKQQNEIAEQKWCSEKSRNIPVDKKHICADISMEMEHDTKGSPNVDNEANTKFNNDDDLISEKKMDGKPEDLNEENTISEHAAADNEFKLHKVKVNNSYQQNDSINAGNELESNDDISAMSDFRENCNTLLDLDSVVNTCKKLNYNENLNKSTLLVGNATETTLNPSCKSLKQTPTDMEMVHPKSRYSHTDAIVDIGKDPVSSLSDNVDMHSCDKHWCLEDVDLQAKDDKYYCCGACTQRFRTVCLLHDHLQGHHQKCSGSYHYDHYTKTAFPKYDTVCRFTQTGDSDKQPENGVKMRMKRTLNQSVNKWKGSKVINKKKKVEEVGKNVIKIDSKELDESKISNETSNNVSIGDAKRDKIDQVEHIWREVKIEAVDDFKNEMCNSDGTDDYFDDGDEAETHALVTKYLKETEVMYEPALNTASGTDEDDTGKVNSKPVRKRKQLQPKSLKKLKKAASMKKKDSTSTVHSRIYNRKERVKVPSNEIPIIATLIDPIPDADCKCELCGAVFAFKRGLLRHEQMKHLDEMTFLCQFCDARFMREYNLQKHVKCVHTLSKNHKYKERYKEKKKLQKEAFEDIDLYEKEMVVVGDCEMKNVIRRSYKKRGDDTSPKTPHTCDICGYTMPRSKMDVHLRIHTGDRPFMCDICGKGLISQNKLKRHMLIHSEVKKHTCDVCGVGFQMKYKLRMHQHIHTGKKPYLCSICGAEFNHSSNLATHTRCVHLQIKPFVCTVCGGCYAKRSQLDDHVLSHSSERQFTCRYCGKSFKYFKGMRRHEKNHYEEKSFECDECDCRFTRKDNLDRHKVSHLEPSLECKTCKKMFKDVKTLKEHENTHSGVKRFQCLLCGDGYQTSGQFYTHMLAAHNIGKEQARLMHNDDRLTRNDSANILNTSPSISLSIDQNLPLQLASDIMPLSNSVKSTMSVNNSSLSVSQMVSGILEENRSTINALTRVATENLRLHSEDIRDDEKLTQVRPPSNPLILLERSHLNLHLVNNSRLHHDNQSRDAVLSMQHGGHMVHDGLQMQQDRQSVNISPMQINDGVRIAHDNHEGVRIAHDSRVVNMSPLDISSGMRLHHDNRTMTPISMSANLRMQQENQAAVESLTRQHQNQSVPLSLISSSQSMMMPQGQRPPHETHEALANQQNNNLGYRIQNLY